LVRRWFEEVWNQGRAELIDALSAPDVATTGLDEGTAEHRGVGPFRIFYDNLRTALPDLHVTVDDILAEGDKVAVRLTAIGTHKQEAMGLRATGRRVTIPAIVIVRVANGKVAQAWNSIDHLGLLKQIGALPAGAIRENLFTTRA